LVIGIFQMYLFPIGEHHTLILYRGCEEVITELKSMNNMMIYSVVVK